MRIEEVRSALVARLRERRPEIEQAVGTRVRAIADPRETADPEYTDSLRAALAAAIDYGIEAIEAGEDRAPPIPVVLLSQARLAARNRVPLEIVLRRYFTGYTLLGDFVVEEAEGAGPLRGAGLKRLLRVQATLFDRLVAAVSEEYGREAIRPGSVQERRTKRVQQLLNGEIGDAPELEYDFSGWHLGLVTTDAAAAQEVRNLPARLDCRMLLAAPAEGTLWAWLGARRALDPSSLTASPPQTSSPVGWAIGEPAAGLEGWRLTHRQARAALPLAQRSGEPCTRYRDVALLAAILQDDLLGSSLRQLYLNPLARERDGGETARQTLRAYFAANGHISSAAVALGVNRNTVSNRLSAIEGHIGRPLTACTTELEAALRLEELAGRADSATR